MARDPARGVRDHLRLNWAHPRPVPTGDGEVAVHLGGRGQPVLLLYGFPESPQVYLPLAEALARDHYVIVPHLPGTGASRRPELAGYSVARNAKRLWTMCEALGARDLDIVGHDLGGSIAAWMAMERVSNVRRLVLISTVLRALSARYVFDRLRLTVPVVSDALFWAAGPAIIRRLYTQRVAPGFSIPETELDRAASTWAPKGGRRNALPYFRTLGNVAALRKFQRAWIRTPTLLVYGDSCRYIGPTSIERTTDCFAHPRVRVLEGVGRCPMVERPQEVTDLVCRFLGHAGGKQKSGLDSMGTPPR